MQNNKILLCVSNTGGGHCSAANAIRNAIGELERSGDVGSFDVVTTAVVEESNVFHHLLVAIYNILLRYRQDWMKYYCNLIELIKPDRSFLGYWLASAYLKEYFARENPVIVVSLHPMANHYLAWALKEAKLPQQPKLIVVVTDPNSNLWTGWACREAYLTIAPNSLVQKRLISLGVDSSRILTVGMPVDPRFLHPPLKTRETFLTELGLNPALPTVCLTAGGVGGGNILKIYGALANVDKPVQVIVICGSNKELYQSIKQQAQNTTLPTAVISSLASMSDLMSACDLLVTKAGGLTTFECVARHLPMAIDMLTEPMPQESGTAELLFDAGLAKPIFRPSDIVPIVETLEHIDDRDKLSLPAKYNLDRTDSVYEIARIILSNCHAAPETNKSKALV